MFGQVARSSYNLSSDDFQPTIINPADPDYSVTHLLSEAIDLSSATNSCNTSINENVSSCILGCAKNVNGGACVTLHH